MTTNPSLDRLCDYYGIARQVRDGEGLEQPVAPAVRRALLDALGVETGNAEVERRSLRQALDRDWRRGLPPVCVAWEEAEAVELSLTLPEHTPLGELRWRLDQEDGAVSGGPLERAWLQTTGAQRLIDGESWTRWRLRLARPEALGWHRVTIQTADAEAPLATTTLVLAPRRAYQPEAVQGDARLWGIATQLDALRSARNWGIGDFTDLTRLIERLSEEGGAALAVPPLHAHLDARASGCDPYRPTSRHALEPLYLDVEAIPELAECADVRAEIEHDDFQARLRALRSAEVLDPNAVAELKLGVLRRLYADFRVRHLAAGSPRVQAFHAFREAEGEPLRQHCLHAALVARHTELDTEAPPELGDFAREHAEEIEFHAWLQWQAREQLRAVGQRSLGLSLALGLCPALAPTVAPAGADAWSQPQCFIHGARTADDTEAGSAPGLPWNPIALRDAAYAPFARMLRTSMAEAGALRIERISDLWRASVVPDGHPTDEGTELAYPFEDLLGILALESVRQRCLLIAEDERPLPDPVSEALVRRGILTTTLLYQAHTADGRLLPPADYPAESATAVGRDGHPPLACFWRGTDIEQRRRLALYRDERDYEAHLVSRSRERAHLFLALERAGLMPDAKARDPVAVPELGPEHLRAVLPGARPRADPMGPRRRPARADPARGPGGQRGQLSQLVPAPAPGDRALARSAADRDADRRRPGGPRTRRAGARADGDDARRRPHPERDLQAAAARRIRLRRRGGTRPLSGAARHQPRLFLALFQGAARQHPRL